LAVSAGSDQPRRPRHLTEEERKLWLAVARSVRRLKRAAPAEAAPVAEPAAKKKPPPAKPAADPAPAPKPKSAPPPLAPLGRRFRQKLGRGTAPIDLRIDLHGMTQAQAHHALTRFLARAQADGAKMVLVITGKGARGDRDLHAERGVLKRVVPQWLGQPELRALVVGFEPAGLGHGGEGALYVRLRRSRAVP
jgi:DNA-nicking Smr family endonuclease